MLELFFNKPISGAFTGSFVGDGSAITGVTASLATSASHALTASFATQAANADTATSASHAVQSDSASLAAQATSASHAVTADSATSASHATTSDTATTASWASKAIVAPANINFNNAFGAEALLSVPTGGAEEQDSGERAAFNLTGYTQARVIVRVLPGAPTLPAGWLAPQFLAIVSQSSEDDNTAWGFLDGIDGPSASMDVSGTIVSSWVDLTAGAQTDVLLRWATFSGSNAGGSNRPAIATINLNVR